MRSQVRYTCTVCEDGVIVTLPTGASVRLSRALIERSCTLRQALPTEKDTEIRLVLPQDYVEAWMISVQQKSLGSRALPSTRATGAHTAP